MSARSAILGKLRVRQTGTVPRPEPAVPLSAQLQSDDMITRFEAELARVHGQSRRLSSLTDAPAAIADYLRANNLPMSLIQAEDARLNALDWSDQPLVEVTRGVPDGSEMTGVTIAEAAAADTGTLLVTSGADRSTTLNFLPDHHIVVLPASAVKAQLSELLAGLDAADLPRTLNLITGPSRTGDIEQTLLLGAHGPRALLVLIVEDGQTD